MKLPKKVIVGGLHFKIKYVIPGKDKGLAEGELGAMILNSQTIWIAKGQTPSMTMLTILHEFLHAIGDTINPNKGPFVKEDFTSTASHLLLQALQSSGLLRKLPG